MFDPCAARAPFDRLEWFALIEETGTWPLVAVADGGDVKAALVLQEKSGRLEAFTNWYSFTWRPIGKGACAPPRFIKAIAADLRKRTHRVLLAPVPEEDGSASLLADAFSSAGWRVEVTCCDTNHILQVGGRSFAEYWTTRPGPLRTTLARKAKRLDIRLSDRFEQALWAQYEQIYEHSWKPREGEPAMLRAFAQREGEAGRLRLGMAYHEGEPIAAQFWTFENGTAYIHKLAHLESHRQLSAGTCLSAALFEQAIDRDCAELIDFGTGDEPYKRDWMDATRPRYQIDCVDMRSPRGWLDLGRLALSRSRMAKVPSLARRPQEG
ncbi:MAG: GNAT family N-acetyltransferase [Erythrobacter sp.]|nr:GNAT family N-acetyltransferase [Erythrobacter sp.]